MRTSRSVRAVVAVAMLVQPLLALAQQTQQSTMPQQSPWNWPGPWHMMWQGAGGLWWIFPLFMILMMVVCAGIFLFGHRSGGGRSHWGPWHMMDGPPRRGGSWGDPASSALQILNERFAKGEIQQQEYEERKAAILSRGQER